MFKNRFILLTTLISLVLVQIMLWSLFLNRANLPPEAPFNYLAPWGKTQLAPSYYLWYLPGWGVLFLIGDLFAGRYFFRREKLMTQLLSLIGVVINFLLTFALLRILNLIFRWI